MPTDWDGGEFVRLVQSKIGSAYAEAVIPALESIPEKYKFCRYHSSCALGLMRPHKPNVQDHFAQAAVAMGQLFSGSDEERRRFVDALFGARAHTIAFAQCLHSTADYLAKVIYRGLDLKGRHSILISDHKIGLRSVKKKASAVPELVNIAQKIGDYLSSPAFMYLSAFVNTEKHHEIVDARFSLAFSVGAVASAGIRMRSFHYSGTDFQEKWATDFFETDFQAILERTTAVGCALNEYLKTR